MFGTAAVTVNVTLTVCGLFDAPEDVTVNVPVYVPAASPEGLTLTLTDPGVVPLAGVADSHPPDVPTA